MTRADSNLTLAMKSGYTARVDSDWRELRRLPDFPTISGADFARVIHGPQPVNAVAAQIRASLAPPVVQPSLTAARPSLAQPRTVAAEPMPASGLLPKQAPKQEEQPKTAPRKVVASKRAGKAKEADEGPTLF